MIKKTLMYIPSVAIPILINVILVFLYAKYLEPNEYGTLNIYLNTINILYSALLSFIQSAAFRFYSVDGASKSRKQYLSTFVLTDIFVTLVLFLLTALVNRFIFTFNYKIIVASVGFNALYQFYLNLYRLEDKNAKYILSRIGASVVTLLGIILFAKVYNNFSYQTIIWLIYGAYGIFALWGVATQREGFSLKDVSFSLIRKSLLFGLPMMGVTLLGNIISSSDQYLLRFFIGETEVGLYSLGYKLSDMSIANITLLILLVATPAVMREYDQNGEDRAIQHLSSILSANIWIVVLIAIEIMCYADEIISVVFPKYAGAETVIRLVTIAAVFHSFSLITCKPFELKKNTHKLFALLLFTAVVNVGYNLVFIPIYGLNAAAHSSIFAYVVYDIILYVSCQSKERVHYSLKQIGQIGLTTIVTCVCGYILKLTWNVNAIWELIIQAFIIALVYFALSFISGIYKILSKL